MVVVGTAESLSDQRSDSRSGLNDSTPPMALQGEIMQSLQSTDEPMDPQEQRRWEAIGQELAKGELERVRGVAGRWATTAGALTGVSTVVGLMTGRERLERLDTSGQVAMAVMLLLAFMATSAAIYLSAKASQGELPAFVNDPSILRDYYSTEPMVVKRQVTYSRRLTLAATLLLVAVIYASWFWPPKPQVNRNYVVIQAGQLTCGDLIADDAGRHSLKTKTGTLTELVNVTVFESVTSCP